MERAKRLEDIELSALHFTAEIIEKVISEIVKRGSHKGEVSNAS